MSSPSLQLRTLRADDLPDALALQSEAYAPHLRDGAAAFESRLTLGPDTCWVARDGDDLLGYLLAHPWGSMRPPPVDTVLRRDPAEGPAILFIHDLSIADAARGTGLGTKLVERALAAARARGLTAAELIAVQGAAGFWRRQGFEPVPATTALTSKLRSYGSDARYLRRPL